MSVEKRITNVTAHPTDMGRGAVDEGVNEVDLYGAAEWLSSRPLVHARLSPQAARKLAIALLLAADRVEVRGEDR